jgi:ribosomal protein L35
MKLRTHKTAAKRIKRATKTGQLLVTTTANSHLRHNKSKRQLSQAKRLQSLAPGMSKRFAKLVPYL